MSGATDILSIDACLARRASFRSGQELAGLIRLEQRVDRLAYADVYSGVVLGTNAECEVYVCSVSELDSSQHQVITQALSCRNRLIHKNLSACAAVGEDQNHLFVAETSAEGRGLSEHLERRRAVQRLFTPSEAYNLLSHVCNGLQFARESGPHDLMCAGLIRILKTGRVHLTRWGFGARRSLMVDSRGRANEWDQGYFAPLPSGADPDLAALGLLSLQLIRCEPYANGIVAAITELESELPAAMSQLLRRCAGEGDTPTIGQFRREMKAALRELRSAKALLHDERSEGLSVPPPLPPAVLFEDSADVMSPTGSFDHLSDHIIAAPASESLRWLVDRDGVDYGPYTQAQILQQLDSEELRPQSIIVDIETDERKPLAEFEAFEDELLRFVHRKDERDTKKRKEDYHRSEETQRRLLIWGGGGVLLLLLLIVGGWRYHLSTLPEPVRANLATLVHPIDWPLPTILPPEPAEGVTDEPGVARARGSKSASRRRGGGGGSETARMRREERLAERSELVMGSGTGAGFDRSAFDRVVARRMRGLYRCLTAAVERNRELKAVHVSLAVLPTGEVINVKAPAMSSAGQRCVRRVLRGARVRPFDGVNVKITLPYRFE